MARAAKKTDVAVATPKAPATLHDMVMALLARPDVTMDVVDRAERLLNLQRQQEYAQAMVACQKEIPLVLKEKSNSQTSSKYASFEKLDRACRPVYVKHGFSLSFGTEEAKSPEMVRVAVDIIHVSGMVKREFLDVPADGKGAKGGEVMTKTHATVSAVSYGKRVLETMIFNIITTEDKILDDDGNRAGGATYFDKKEIAALKKELDSFAADHSQFLEYIGADSFESILVAQRRQVEATLKAAKRARAKAAVKQGDGSPAEGKGEPENG